MGINSAIEWTTHTFNPWWGCTKVSPACDHCYAETWAKRTGFEIWGQDATRRFFGDKHWAEPLKWSRDAEKTGERSRVFCASMCDILEDRRDLDASRQRLWDLIEETPFLDWLLLTKRPQSYQRMLPAAWRENPRPHVWLGATVESPEYLWRVVYLLVVRAAVHWISAEPLLASVDFKPHLFRLKCGACRTELWPSQFRGECPVCGNGTVQEIPGLGLIIVGGESGPKARPSHPRWFRDVRDQCVAAGVPYFFKQHGDWASEAATIGDAQPESIGPDRARWISPDGVVSPTGEGLMKKGDALVVRVGKKIAGAILDGREWRELPTAGGAR